MAARYWGLGLHSPASRPAIPQIGGGAQNLELGVNLGCPLPLGAIIAWRYYSPR